MSIFQIYDFRQIVINGLKPISSGSKLTPYLSVKLNEVKVRQFLYSSAFFLNYFWKSPNPKKFVKNIRNETHRHLELTVLNTFSEKKIKKKSYFWSNLILENGQH